MVEKRDIPEACFNCPLITKPSRLCKKCKNFDEAEAFWSDYDDLDDEPYEVIT